MPTIALHALAGSSPPIVARISAAAEILARAGEGLPDGAALPEAVAARLLRAGAKPVWGEPVEPPDRRTFLRARGASSVAIFRADPSLLPDLELGRWFGRRLVDRLALRAQLAARVELDDAATFWRAVRNAATRAEWRRLTLSSYVVLLYHRVAEPKAGQERLIVPPERFERQLGMLRRLGLRPLSVEQVERFHADPAATLPRRGVLLSSDDGFADAVAALRRHGDLRPLVFVPTAAVGGPARWPWADGEPIASWQDLRELVAAGGAVGSHTRSHPLLPDIDEASLDDELASSLAELRAEVPAAVAAVAYPHGGNDARVRAAAAAAGYRLGFTTETGRNGAGTSPYRLRRVEPKAWDGPLAFAWKALTGEGLPWTIERLRRRR